MKHLLDRPLSVYLRFRLKEFDYQWGGQDSTIFVPTECWAMIPDYLIEKNWVELGGAHGDPKPSTLEYLIQKYTSGVSAVSYVAPILEKIGIAEIDRERPGRIRLI